VKRDKNRRLFTEQTCGQERRSFALFSSEGYTSLARSMDYSERCSTTVLVKVESIVTYMHGSVSSLDSLKAEKKEVVC
jgi:hypothetical protein